MKKLCVLLLTLLLMSACGTKQEVKDGKTVYHIGLCNYADDASLNQIVENIQSELKNIEAENDCYFEIDYENCNADQAVLEQIISNFIYDDVDLMIAVATPVAIAMQHATQDNAIPVVFAAVSDPVGSELAASLEAPGSNLTGTSDYLNTEALLELIFAVDPETDFVGLLYDPGQDASSQPIAIAKEYLATRNIKYKEYAGTNTSEIMLACANIIADQPDALFTPTDNTVMTAEYSIYEDLIEADIKQYCGADSFALNGAFIGYGVDYVLLGKQTAIMAADILINKLDPATYPIKTFDNGLVIINTQTAKLLGISVEDVKEKLMPLVSGINEISTAEAFD